MNLGQLKAALERRTGVAFDPTAATEALNEALQAINGEERWPWMQTTWSFAGVASQSIYPLLAAQQGVRSVTVNGSDIPRRSQAELDEDPFVVGWALYGGSLLLSPASGGGEAVQARVDLAEPALVADSDTPLLPAQWHGQALVNLAASIVLERVGEIDRADRRLKDYDRALKRMRHTGRRARGPIAVRVRPGGAL